MKEQKTNFDTETARDDSDVILDVRNLDVYLNTYSGRIHAVRDVSFTLKKGETLVVVGESGCGKSMTARAIMQLLPEKISEVGERSQILFNGTDILKMPEKKKETELRGKYISMIFQDPTTFLNPTMTVGEQIAESLLLHSKMKKKEAMEQALSLLKMVKITNPEKRIRQYPHELSGGMRQRVMIAMALACEPKILIADEPTTALDVTTQADIMELIRERKAVVLLNKSDLEPVVSLEEIAEKSGHRVISISAKEETGIDQLEEEIKSLFYEGEIDFNDQILITNVRHAEALREAYDSIRMVENSIESGMPEDFFSIDLMNAYEKLGLIVGEAVEDDLVNEIFSKFCMGK